MRQARDIASEKILLEQFVEKYRLKDFGRGKEIGPGFFGSLRAIQNDGIFIPEQKFYGKENFEFSYFHPDYGNRFIGSRLGPNTKNALFLMDDHTWKPEDFTALEIIERGEKFGRDMWKTCVDGFEEWKSITQYQRVIDIGRELIKYYSEIMNEPTD